MALPDEGDWLDVDDLNTTNMNARLRDVLAFLMDRPIFRGRQTVAQTLTTATFAAVTMTAEDVDTHGGHSTSSNTSRYVAPEDGWYECSGGVGFASNATGFRACEWRKNGTALAGSDARAPAVAAGSSSSVAARTILVSLSAGDYVELFAFQNSGGDLGTSVVADVESAVNVEWVRRL
jgi:hypothetical protein